MNRRISYLIVALVFIFCTFSSAATIEGISASLGATDLLLVAAPEDDTDNPDEEEDPPVEDDPPAPEISLSFTNPPDTMNVGEKTQISFALRDAPKNTNLNWTSSNKNVAKVDSEGNVEALSPGKVEITASVPNSGIKTSTLIEVKEIEAKSVKITALEISGADLLLGKHEIKIGDIVHLDFDVDPKDAVKGDPKWSSSDQTILSVDKKGVVKAIAEGEATVVLNVGDLSDEISFTVVEEKSGLGINLWIIISAILLLIAIIVIIVVVVKRKKLKKEEEEEAERQRIKNAIQRDRTMRQPPENREVPYRDIFDEQSTDRSTKVFTPVYVDSPTEPFEPIDDTDPFASPNESKIDIDDIIDVDEETDYLKDNNKAPEKDEPFSLEDIDDLK